MVDQVRAKVSTACHPVVTASTDDGVTVYARRPAWARRVSGEPRAPSSECRHGTRHAAHSGARRRKEIPPTGKSFDVDFCTVARWDNGQIVEENLSYDPVTFMKQIGLSK